MAEKDKERLLSRTSSEEDKLNRKSYRSFEIVAAPSARPSDASDKSVLISKDYIARLNSEGIVSNGAEIVASKKKSKDSSKEIKNSITGSKKRTGNNTNGNMKSWWRERLLSLLKASPRLSPGLFILIALVLAIAVILWGVIYDLVSNSPIKFCQGPPYLYVTHSDAKNILKFSLDGCLLATRVLWGNYDHSDLRGLVVDRSTTNHIRGHGWSDSLIVADSSYSSSQLLKFGSCSRWTGMRILTGKIADYNSNEAVQHPYSISLDDDRNIYATFQNTDVLIRFRADTYEPLPSPPMLRESTMLIQKLIDTQDSKKKKNKTDNSTVDYDSSYNDIIFYPGTFVQFGSIGMHSHVNQGIRAVQFVRARPHGRIATVWVTNKNLNTIFVFDAISGNITSAIPLGDPIGLHVNYQHSLMFVGSKASKAAQVLAYDLDTHEIRRRFSLLSMKHPTGITSQRDELIVADQEANAIWSFNITSGRYLRLVVPSETLEKLHAGDLELIALSDC